MKMIHEKLGACEILISFQSDKNQLALVRAHKKTGILKSTDKWGIVNNKWGTSPKFWLLWGDIGSSISELGKTCLLTEKGKKISQTQATNIFMKASLMIDKMEFKKLK